MATQEKTNETLLAKRRESSKRRPSGNEQKSPFDGAPITIGGGAGEDDKDTRTRTIRLGCSFNHGAYIDHNDPTGTSPKKRKFDHPGWRIEALLLTFTGGQLDFTPLLPDDRDGTVLVKCRDDSDTRERMKIYGNPLGIEFHTGKYPPDSTSPNDHHNTDPTSYISKVEIDFSPKFYFERTFLPGDLCEVFVNMMPPGPKTRSRKAKR